MKTGVLAALLALTALTCAAACNQAEPVDPSAPKDAGGNTGDGGGGAGGGGGGGGAAGPDYFPLRDGASWKYLHSNGGWTETITAEASSTKGRFVLTASADPAGLSSVSTLAQVDGDVLRVAEDTLLDGVLAQTATYDPGFLRFSTAWADQEPGFTETRSYDRSETKAGSSVKAPAARAHVYTLEATSESVSVPAGAFRQCLRVRRKRDYEVSTPDGGTVAEEQEKLFWFCPGVGKVREENALTGSSEVLMQYDLPKP